MPTGERQSIGRAEPYGVLAAVESQAPGVSLHAVTDSKIAYARLKGKCAKWEQHGSVGPRGPLLHGDLWECLWGSWQLFGDNVSVQWVASHVGGHAACREVAQPI